jgi:hypothetical protein
MNTSGQRIGLRAKQQRGITMFEVLVTLAIITVWLLATAGVQTSSAKLEQGGPVSHQAVINASDIVERIEANKTAPDARYECGGSNAACIPAASTMPSCTGAWRTCGLRQVGMGDPTYRDASIRRRWLDKHCVERRCDPTHLHDHHRLDRSRRQPYHGNTEPSTYQTVKSIN